MQWGLALNPNQNGIKILLFFVFLFFSFLEMKSSFFGPRKKRPHKVVNNNLFFFVYANGILYIYNLY